MNPKNKWLLGTVSATLVSGLVAWEGTRYMPYKDIGGIPTVCQGHTGKDINMNKLYTDAECRAILIKDIQSHGGGILECITEPINQNEYDGYTMFAFNVGTTAFCSSRANKLLSQGKHTEACNALATGPDGKSAWSYVNGKFVKGLQNRRQFERDLCLGRKK